MKKIILSALFLAFMGNAKTQVLIQWQKCLGGSNYEESFYIQQTTDSGYILVGWTSSNDGDVSGNHGFTDAWVVKVDSVGNIQWQKNMGGSGIDHVLSIQQTTDGGYILTGWTTSNDGDVSGNHGGSDVWVIKIDLVGNIQWQKCLGGSSDDYATSIQQTTDGGYILVGITNSNDGDVTGNNGGSDVWVVKLDTTGNIQWQKCYGGISLEAANSIQQTTDGGYIFAGWAGSNSGDVSGNHGGIDVWVVKLDMVGNIQWQKCLGGSIDDWASSIQQTTDGGYIVAGITHSHDGDVSFNHGGGDAWVLKLDVVGNIQWQKCLGGSYLEQANSIQQTTDGGYIVAGQAEYNDGDVSGNHGGLDVWVVKLDAVGNIQWQKCLGGSIDEFAHSIKQTLDGGYIIAGRTNSNDDDVYGNHGLDDVWIIKIIEPNISGFVFRDDNFNGVHDAGEQGVAGHLIKLEPGPIYTVTNNDGNYYFAADLGTHTVSYVSYPYWITTGNPFYNVTINNPSVFIDTLDFAVIPHLNVKDVAVYITGSPTRAGFETHYWLTNKNWGTITTSGNVNFQYDTLLTYITSTLSPTSHIGNVLEWNYGPLGHNVQQDIQVTFQMPGVQYLGDTLFSNAWITPFALDTNITNNYDTLYQEITGAYDPNDKLVMPQGYGSEGYVLHGERLTYTVRFQNTGTDTAFTVVIRDTLDINNLNLETFLLEAYSHAVQWELWNSQELVFTFNNILLPDSNVNEPLSHGFVRFSISPKSGLPDFTEVRNSASIYFDYNPAIVTNTTLNTYVTTIPFNIAKNESEHLQVLVFPNPANDKLTIVIKEENSKNITITDVLGRVLFQTKTEETQLTLDISGFSNGLYFVSVQTEKGQAVMKVIKK
jgi:hypothetical protein